MEYKISTDKKNWILYTILTGIFSYNKNGGNFFGEISSGNSQPDPKVQSKNHALV